MSGPIQPLNLVIANWKKHLTNAEIEALTAQGYKAEVAYGLEEAKNVIEGYLQRD